jgi:hypothetical protein
MDTIRTFRITLEKEVMLQVFLVSILNLKKSQFKKLSISAPQAFILTQFTPYTTSAKPDRWGYISSNYKFMG